MKRSLLFSLMLFVVTVCVAAGCRTLGSYTVDPKQSGGQIGFKIEKIEFRDDLTRIYGSPVVRPHTSGRIDSMTLIPDGGSALMWTDIDGVDMKRWFQWEDGNYIPVEIDFPAMKSPKTITVRLTGPKGPSVWVIKRKAK